MIERHFPILDTTCEPRFVPWSLVAPHEARALRNHGQTLARLAERGGLSYCELVAVVEGRAWSKMDTNAAKERVITLLNTATTP